jgi:hypothetical protein
VTSPRDEDRRADRRFWLGVSGFLLLLAVMLAIGWVCGADQPPDDPNPNAKLQRLAGT